MKIKFYEFISNRSVATLSVIATSILAIYLSSVDNKITAGDYGVFSLQTAFSSDAFSKILGSMKITGNDFLTHYLLIDILFSVCCAFTFPSVMALMFSQYKQMLEESFKQSPSQFLSRILAFAFFLAPLIAILSLIGNSFILSMLRSGNISNSMVFAASIVHVVKFVILFAIIAFLIFLLILRRKIIKSAYQREQ